MIPRILVTALIIATISAFSFQGNPIHSLVSELHNLYQVDNLALIDSGSFSAQVSSYDTTGGNDDGFSGKYSFISRNEDSTLVLFDMKGPGVINRFWTPTPTDDTLDFYIDSSRPGFSLKYMDLFSGKVYPFIAPLCGNQIGGFYSYVPILFNESCKIVIRAKKTQFHQIQYKLFKPGEKVKSFDFNLNMEERESLKTVADLWNKKSKNIQDFHKTRYPNLQKDIELSVGKSIPIFELNSGGRIRGIEIEPISALEGNRDLDLKITWDNEKIPAIYCPVADFFGLAFGKASMQSLLLGSEGKKCYSYFTMPFDQSAKIELLLRQRGTTSTKVKLHTTVYYESTKRTKSEGKFYTQWGSPIMSEIGKPHQIANHQGAGNYIGTILYAQGLQPGMSYFFEGDDSTAIDGEMRLHGTGSEDYFNGGWYAMMDRWDGKMSLPTHGALDYSLPFCRTGGYRFYLNDKLSFSKSIYQSIEHGPSGNLFPVKYTSLGLFYSTTPLKNFMLPNNQLTEIYEPDTMYIYPQLMEYNIFGNMDIKTSWKYGTGGESYKFSPGDDSWIRISLKEIPKGKYDLFFDITNEATGNSFSVWQRQTSISDWISTYSNLESRVRDKFINEIDIQDFQNSLTLRFKNEGEKRSFLLHRMMLVKK